MIKLPAKENTLYINKVPSSVGDYVDSEENRYDLNVASEVCMPDTADPSIWTEVHGREDPNPEDPEHPIKVEPLQVYLETYGLEYKPLSEEDREEIFNKLYEN